MHKNLYAAAQQELLKFIGRQGPPANASLTGRLLLIHHWAHPIRYRASNFSLLLWRGSAQSFPRGEAAPVRTLGLKRNTGENVELLPLFRLLPAR